MQILKKNSNEFLLIIFPFLIKLNLGKNIYINGEISLMFIVIIYVSLILNFDKVEN